MFKFMILFRPPAEIDPFENSYNDLLALIERMPHVVRRQVVSVIGSPLGAAPYYRILEVYFPDQATMQEALRTPQGQEAGSQMATFPGGSFEMIFAEVYEEQGGRTPPHSTGASN